MTVRHLLNIVDLSVDELALIEIFQIAQLMTSDVLSPAASR